jgi:MATE family multidrug resistance protein
MTTVDTLMLGRYSPEAMAAAAVGHAVGWAIQIGPMALLYGLDPFVAQAYGAGDRRAVSRHLSRALVLAAFLTGPTVAALWIVGPWLSGLGQEPEVVPLVTDYLRALCLGVPGLLAFTLFRQTLQAMGVVRPALFAVLVANAFNVVANRVLIFGALGVPSLGVLGSGLATSFSRLLLAVVLVVAARSQLQQFDLAGWREHLRLSSHRALLRLGGPIAVQQSLEFWVFSAVGLLAGTFGATAMAGHQIALNLASLSFMLPLGVAGAATTRVGNAIGRRDLEGARRSAVCALWLGLAVMTFSAVIFGLFPHTLSRAYTPNAEVVAMGAALLPIAALFQLADGVQVVMAGVLRGASDTRWPAILALVGFWLIGLPVGVLLAFPGGLGPRGLWWGLSAGLVSVALLLALRARWRLRGPLEAILAREA